MAYRTIGNTVAEWDNNEPFIFTLKEETGSEDDRRPTTVQFDLSSLRAGFEDEFIVNLKNHFIERRHRIALITIKTEYELLGSLFRHVIDHNLFDTRRSVIDEHFLLAMNAIIEELPLVSLECLRRTYNSNPQSPIFAHGLRGDDFPIKSHKKNSHGKRIDSILGKALTRTACVEILSWCEQAYEEGVIDISLLSFINLAFSVYVRTDSYRRIKLHDLVYDTDEDAFFLYILPLKSGVHQPQKIPYRINKHVGVLLLKQRQQVIEKFSHMVAEDDIGKLALFPATKLNHDKSGWAAMYTNECFGEFLSSSSFGSKYFNKIRRKMLNSQYGLNAVVLRHTIGTQLAELGCSAKTIQAVLKHADDGTCMAYVDIAFHGLINELSDAMQPAFEAYLPVFQRFRSKDDWVAPSKAIYSENIETGQTELTGECGKQIRCQAAPFTCYECNKFVPCFDTDHSLNLDIVLCEIDKFKYAGTPYRHLVEKAKSIKYRIQLVMAACDRYQQTIAGEKEWS